MSVYKPAKSPFWHFDFQWKGHRFHGSTGCSSRRDAQRYENERRRDAALGLARRQEITVDEAIGTWWRDRGQHLKSAADIKYQAQALIDGLGARALLSGVTQADFREYVARRRRGRANASVNREIAMARPAWKHARKAGYQVADIDWGDLMLSEPAERIREMTTEEEARLWEALSTDLQNIVEAAMLSGKRRTEIVTLRWADVDFIGARATVTIKGGARSTFTLTPRLVALIANQPKVCAQVFTYEARANNPPRGDRPRRIKGERYPFSKQGWARQWRQALATAGIEDFRFHDLRHTFATRLLRDSNNLKIVQQALAHSSIAVTAKYAHAMEDDVRSAMSAAESRNSPEPKTAEAINPLRKLA